MFLNKTIFKRMIKEAYGNSRLEVGRLFGGLLVSTGYCVLWVETGYEPKWLKAAVMEYAGELPETDEIFIASKKEPLRYIEGDELKAEKTEHLNILKQHKLAREAFIDTGVITEANGGRFRLLQHVDTGEIIPLPEEFFDVIDYMALHEDENPPTGPCAVQKGCPIFWRNEHCAYMARPVRLTSDKPVEVVSLLGAIDFGKDVK